MQPTAKLKTVLAASALALTAGTGAAAAQDAPKVGS